MYELQLAAAALTVLALALPGAWFLLRREIRRQMKGVSQQARENLAAETRTAEALHRMELHLERIETLLDSAELPSQEAGTQASREMRQGIENILGYSPAQAREVRP